MANSSNGYISISSYPSAPRKHDEDEIAKACEEYYKNQSIKIITQTKDNLLELQDSLILASNKCRICNKKEKWAKKPIMPIVKGLIGLFVIATIILLIALLNQSAKHDLSTALIISTISVAVCAMAFIVICLMIKKGARRTPEDSIPVILCFEKNLVDYSWRKGLDITSPNRIIPPEEVQRRKKEERIRFMEEEEAKRQKKEIKKKDPQEGMAYNKEASPVLPKECGVGQIICPKCNIKQRDNRSLCMNCGQPFLQLEVK